jgi:hypothetical protein
MNKATHYISHISQYKLPSKVLTGTVTGEFSRGTGLPDGRCRFYSTDVENQFTILGYFKNGELQIGPQLYFDKVNGLLEIVSPFHKIFGLKDCYTRSSISLNDKGKTEYFVEGRLEHEIDCMWSEALDWILLPRRETLTEN